MRFSPRARGFFAVTFTALAAFAAVSLTTISPTDWPFVNGSPVGDVTNLAGPFGSLIAYLAFELFGRAFAWFVPVAFLTLGINAARSAPAIRRWLFKAASVVILLNALFALIPLTRHAPSLHGRVGDGIAAALGTVAGQIGGAIVLVAGILLIGLGELGELVQVGVSGAGRMRRVAFGLPVLARSGRALARRVTLYREAVRDSLTGEEDAFEIGGAQDPGTREVIGRTEDSRDRLPALPGSASAAAAWEDPDPHRARSSPAITSHEPGRRRVGRRRGKLRKPGEVLRPLSQASLPPSSLLGSGGNGSGTYTREELKNWSTVLEEKLGNYGVEGRVSAVHHGPVVTTFEFEPAPGVRIKEIVNRADDLALAMRARSLRMIAPIPGRAAVGIEIPNPEARTVYFGDVLRAIPENQRLRGVMLGLGVDVVGKPFVMNLCDAPHLLIAGTTGSGKSVCLNCILSSILFQYRPSDVRLLLVDPKIVEMSLYNGIPHLMHPVITDPKEAAKVLEYLVAEMTRRNELFRRHGVRNIESYNAKVAHGGTVVDDGEPMERLPYIVLMVDELGDLALARGVDLESLLARLAQMARAAGIHMVLATQRPSVDVIVGKTKANFPTRIAFRVATRVDSRTIIDTIGADKLLGRGDMLYLDAKNLTPLRLHGAWVSENELEQLIDHWKSYEYDEAALNLTPAGAGSARSGQDLDPLFDDARAVVLRFKQGSTSLLQRKLRVGYSRAARLVDQLEQAGIVGPPDGSKPREVYLDDTDTGGIDSL